MGVTCPIITLRPEAELPIMRSTPTSSRRSRSGSSSWAGHCARSSVVALGPTVAIIGTGHLSLEGGGPRKFGPHGPDSEFDRKALDWIATGDIKSCRADVTLYSLHAPDYATRGFMDFMLVMGLAGENAKADHVDSLDLFHTMEAYFTGSPREPPHDTVRLAHASGEDSMSKYLLDKFLYTVDRDPDLVERYREDPQSTVEWWDARARQRSAQLLLR